MTRVTQAFPPCPHGRDDDCQLEMGPTSSTLLGWRQIYDRAGNPLYRDPNTSRTAIICRTCGATWERWEDARGYEDREVSRGRR